MTPITEIPPDRLTYLVLNGKTALIRKQCAVELARRDQAKAQARARSGTRTAALEPAVGPDGLAPRPKSQKEQTDEANRIRLERGWDRESQEDHGYTSVGAVVERVMKGRTE
jgi:hypothetical protein